MTIQTRSVRLITLSAIAFAGTACGVKLPALPSSVRLTPTIAESATSAPVTSTLPIATRAAPLTPIKPTGAITLTLWTTEDLAPSSSAAGKILRNQFDAFTAANPNIHIETILKKPYGKGGMLDFLTTTSEVVPDLLPDLAALDISEVPQAASAGLLQPLDPLLSSDVKGDFFPFAYQASMYHGKWVAVPFTADVEHLIYNKGIVKRVPPTWDDFLKQRSTLLLPLAGDNAFLVQYLALAPLFDANGQLTFDENAASQVLSFFKRAHDLALIPDSAIALTSSDSAWSSFSTGKVAMIQGSASSYLAQRAKLPNALYASVPTRDGKIAAVASGWAYVVVTNDPARQAAVAQFIQWIVQGEHLAPWLRAANRLPASRSTLALTVEPVEYATFLRSQMENASYLPPTAAYAKASDAWRAATAAVLRGQTTPEEAARSMSDALK
jgi:ABC-type glycerol-3-phosphate transport system substrate-binding protein